MADAYGPQPQPRQAGGDDFWKNLGVGGYSALNSVGFGLPDMLQKMIDEKGYASTLADRAKYKEADMAGNIAGLAGSMIIPGGAIARGLGAGAKLAGMANVGSKLTKFADVAKGATKLGKSPLAQGAIRGLASAGEQSLARLVPEMVTSEDVGGSLQNALVGTALGGGIGGALPMAGKLAKKAFGSDFIKRNLGEAVEGAEYATASNMGLKARPLKNELRTVLGNTRTSNRALEQADESIKNFNRVGKQEGWIHEAGRDDNIREGLGRLSGEYDSAITQAVKQPGVSSSITKNINDSIDEVSSSGLTKDWGNKNPYDEVKKMIASTSRQPEGMSALRNKLTEEISSMRPSMQSFTDAQRAKYSALVASRTAMNDALDAISANTGGRTLKEIGKDYRAFKTAQESALLDKYTQAGTKGGGSPTFEKAMVGSAIGGLSGAGDWQEDPGMAVTKLVGGALGGQAMNKLVPKLAGRLQASTLPMLSKIEGMASKISGATSKLGANIAEAPAIALPETNDKLLQPELFSPTAVPESVPVSDNFRSRIMAKLEQDYQQNGIAQEGIPFEQFVSMVEQKTGGFDPARSAGILYRDPKEKAKFRADLRVANAVMGADLGKAGDTGWFTPEENKKVLMDLKGAFQSILSDNGQKNIGKDQQKLLDEQLTAILKTDGTPEQKKAMLADLLQMNYGVSQEAFV